MTGVRVLERREFQQTDRAQDVHITLGHGRAPRLLESVPRWTGVVLGVVGILAATGSTLALRERGSRPAPPPSRSAWTLIDGSTVSTTGPTEVVAQAMTYAPGQSSGWHSHPGLHVVTVVSGTLTVYGSDCRPRSYGPGEVYIGGDSTHLARNEGDIPLEMGVIYLMTPGQSIDVFRVSHLAPTVCGPE